MDQQEKRQQEMSGYRKLSRGLVISGNFITTIGVGLLIAALFDTFNIEFFSIGASSGLRIISEVAVSGCLLSAIGYWISEQNY